MALEDRCSPQSAPSPPGIPHSPHNTTTNIYLNIKNSPSRNEMALDTSKIEISDSNRLNYQENFNEKLSPPQSPAANQTQNEPINFSISNILSDRFGKTKLKLSNHENKKEILFRPYEIKSPSLINHSQNQPQSSPSSTSSPTPPSPLIDEQKFSSFFKIFDFSKQKQIFEENILKLNSGLVNNYPKIHEEYFNRNNKQSINLPPLGGLCKTISQIGQISPQSRNTFSPKSESSVLSGRSSTNLPLQRNDSGVESSDDTRSESGSTKDDNGQSSWPAWVYCTRYSDRPSSGPRYRRPKKPKDKTAPVTDDKRPRTAFSSEQLAKLKQEFIENRYLTERRRQQLSADLGLNEAQIKIWFQNKRAKIKKSTGQKNPLALQLMAQGLYNHTTVPLTPEEEELERRMNEQLMSNE